MEITKTIDGTKATLALDGWLDTQTAPELEAALAELDDSVSELDIDCSGLEYISSAGIRQIVAVHKKMGGKLALRDVSPEVREVLRLTGTLKRLTIL